MSLARFEELYESYCDGELSAEERGEFLRLMENAEVRARFVELSVLEAAASEELRLASASGEEARPARAPSTAQIRATAKRRRSNSQVRRRTTRTKAWLKYGVLPLTAAAAVLVAAHFYNLRTIREAQSAEIIEIRGEVKLTQDGAARPALKGEKVEPGGSIELAPGSSLELKYPDKSRVDASGDARLGFVEGHAGKTIRLEKGTITVDAAKQPAGAPMVLRTKHAEATVVGTQFTLRAEAGKTRLEVREGIVRLKSLSGGGSDDVPAGYYAEAAVGTRVVATRIKGPPDRIAKPLFAADFEKTPIGSRPPGFTPGHSGSWKVREFQGSRVLEGSGKKTSVLFGSKHWTDYEVRLRVRCEKRPEYVGVVVRHDPASGRNYQLELHADKVRLARSLDADKDDPDPLTDSRARLQPGQWQYLRITCRGERIEFRVNDKLVISSRETNSARGLCKFFIDNGRVVFDDIEVLPLKPQKH